MDMIDQIPSFQLCKYACLGTPNCVTVEWKGKYKKCYLKDNSHNDLVEDEDSIVAFIVCIKTEGNVHILVFFLL